MRFKKVYGFKLMKVGKTQNTLELDEDIIEESVIHHVFDNAPIVFNENQNFKDYRNNDDVENFVRENVIAINATKKTYKITIIQNPPTFFLYFLILQEY